MLFKNDIQFANVRKQIKSTNLQSYHEIVEGRFPETFYTFYNTRW